MSKQATVFKVMEKYSDKPMEFVLQKIVDATAHMPGKPIDLKRAKAYYTDAVKKGLAPGAVEKTARAKAVTRMAKEVIAKTKMVKVPKPKVQGDKPKVTDKTVEEIADIRAKNLARLKAVGQKYAKGQYAEGKAGGFSKAEAKAAKDYVSSVTNDLDSFKAPAFLSADDVKALV